MSNTEHSRILGNIKKNLGAAYEEAKKQPPRVKGNALPGNIRGGKALFTSYDLTETDKGAIPVFKLVFSVVEPSLYRNVRQEITLFLQENQYATQEKLSEDLASTLQLLGVSKSNLDLNEKTLKELDSLLNSYIIYNTREGTFTDSKTKEKRSWFSFDLVGNAGKEDQAPSNLVTEDNEEIYEEEEEEPEIYEEEEDSEEEEVPFDYSEEASKETLEDSEEEEEEFEYLEETSEEEDSEEEEKNPFSEAIEEHDGEFNINNIFYHKFAGKRKYTKLMLTEIDEESATLIDEKGNSHQISYDELYWGDPEE